MTLRANTALGGRAALRAALARDAPAALLESSDGELSPWAVRHLLLLRTSAASTASTASASSTSTQLLHLLHHIHLHRLL